MSLFDLLICYGSMFIGFVIVGIIYLVKTKRKESKNV